MEETKGKTNKRKSLQYDEEMQRKKKKLKCQSNTKRRMKTAKKRGRNTFMKIIEVKKETGGEKWEIKYKV